MQGTPSVLNLLPNLASFDVCFVIGFIGYNFKSGLVFNRQQDKATRPLYDTLELHKLLKNKILILKINTTFENIFSKNVIIKSFIL